MELKVVKESEEGKRLLLEVQGETETLTHLLREHLWELAEVSEAAHIKEHPLLAEPKLLVRTRQSTARESLLKVADVLLTKIEELEKLVEHEVESIEPK